VNTQKAPAGSGKTADASTAASGTSEEHSEALDRSLPPLSIHLMAADQPAVGRTERADTLNEPRRCKHWRAVRPEARSE